jgi:hypothetical protein
VRAQGRTSEVPGQYMTAVLQSGRTKGVGVSPDESCGVIHAADSGHKVRWTAQYSRA